MSELKELDWDLIRDCVLFKQNDISHLSHIVYDIKIKGINTDFNRDRLLGLQNRIVVYFDRWDVKYKNNLTMFGGQSNSVVADDVSINIQEYLVLVREKKLKELGI
jgi:hypothetical protein